MKYLVPFFVQHLLLFTVTALVTASLSMETALGRESCFFYGKGGLG